MKKILDVPVPSSAPAMKKLGRSKPKKQTSTHRMRYREMITSAVNALRKPHGSSRQAITKYLKSNFDVSPDHLNRHVNKNLKQMLSNDQLVLTSGCGAAGRYKVNRRTAAVGSQTVSKKKPAKKSVRASKKKPLKKPTKKKSPVKKRIAKRTTKKPAKPSKRTGKKKSPKKLKAKK